MTRLLGLLLAVGLLQTAWGTSPARKKSPSRKSGTRSKVARTSNATAWRQPTYIDPTEGDNVDGDDLAVRRAAVEALGNFNGSVVVVDPGNGRILTIVNQKLALQSGFIPCSTIKLVTAFAALREGLLEGSTAMRIGRYFRMDLTSAIAHSNNPYFKILGQKLGFERVVHYARQFGLGERASWNLDNEQPGALPEAPPANGGVGMMTSFGEGITLTPLQLAALLSAISNRGTLYYLQYPRSQQEIDDFAPRFKRQLDIGPYIDEVKQGMRAAVDFGTAKRANYDPNEPVLGKTGTCTDYHAYVHMGWFGSFNDVERHRLVVVVMLTGGKSVNGPVAAGVAGNVYRNLSAQRFFASNRTGEIFASACCAK